MIEIARIAKDRRNWAIDQLGLKSSMFGNAGNFGSFKTDRNQARSETAPRWKDCER
jgi:hypothetical protein